MGTRSKSRTRQLKQSNGCTATTSGASDRRRRARRRTAPAWLREDEWLRHHLPHPPRQLSRCLHRRRRSACHHRYSRRTPKGGLLMTSSLVPISEARAHLSRLVRESADDDVVLMNHGRPAAILISAERYESLMEELEDLRDRLSVHEREHVTMPLDKLGAELGVDIGRV
ncbi:prevent-host-death family protein [Mycobacterium tuberculosis variant africanum MAL010120]|nr:prevent-host-death family protein [Mycobacterium tuberculosis variant africanum MAL010120]KBH66523.1 prevent-host-death family protein [Mycobacterium tuberculosis variant africanum MAL020135]